MDLNLIRLLLCELTYRLLLEMCLLFKKLTYTFCLNEIFENKKNFQYKICYKKKYKFLNLKNTPSQALANRLMKRGNFLKTYKLLKKFYYNFILKFNFKKIPVTSNFLFFYNKYHSFKNFDKVLLWKYKSLDCMFSLKTRKIKKKKSLNLIFTAGINRILFCINIIKFTILLNLKRKKKNLNYEYFNPLYKFLMYDRNNLILKFKYRIYKHKLMQLQQ